jgi:hypothetical protein
VTLSPGFGLLKEGPMPWQRSSPWSSVGNSFTTRCVEWSPLPSSVPATASVGRPATSSWLRYEALGAAGLADQSRRPHRSPTALDPVLLQRLLEAQHRHPYRGPRKLLRLVGDRWPQASWPVRSTVARCFQHLGLVTARRRVRRPGPAGPPLAPMDAPRSTTASGMSTSARSA